MDEDVERGTDEAAASRLRPVIDPELAQILAHPLRGHILLVLNERTASPNEIAQEIGIPVSDVSYHARKLREEGYIRLVETKRRRGAIEHFYEANEMFFLDDQDWMQMPVTVKPLISARVFNLLFAEAAKSLAAGKMDDRTRHLSWTAMELDEAGWGELMTVLGGALERVLEIKAQSAERLRGSGEPSIPTLVSLIGFEADREIADGDGS